MGVGRLRRIPCRKINLLKHCIDATILIVQSDNHKTIVSSPLERREKIAVT
jgi:hypothetical protein